MKLLLLVLAGAFVTACNLSSPHRAPARVTNASREFVLYSWTGPGRDYNFAIFPSGTEAAFLKNFKPERFGLRGLKQLKAALEKLPPRAVVVWEDDKIKGIDYPPIADMQQVELFTRACGLKLEYNPSVLE